MLSLFYLGFFIIVVSTNNVLDVEDILDDNFMPGSLLVLEGTDSYQNESVKPETTQNVLDGSFHGAISTMDFHRQKMNEYLCRSYIAGQILTDMSMSRIRRRLGQPSLVGRQMSMKAQSKIDKPEIKDTLLSDEGSLNYKQWLKKSMTLEDIYRQIREREDEKEELEVVNDNISEEFEGEVTGYAMPVNHGPGAPPKMSHSPYGYSDVGSYGGGHPGYGNAGGYDYTPHVHYIQEESHGKDKDVILSDLFEIALTAIAFISFGCFIIQVIMCISMATNTTTSMPMTMMPMMMPTTTDGTVEPVEPIKISNKINFGSSRQDRVKRDLEINTNAAMNELSRRVLLSIEAAMVTEEDNGNCLRRKLCEDNKYSRTLSDNQRIWIPVWSFGMSWLSGRLTIKVPPATAMLDTLKASILGLGNGKCELLYNNCTLHALRENRRRKRSYNMYDKRA